MVRAVAAGGRLDGLIGGTLLAGVLVFQIALRGAGSLALRALFALLGLGLLGELGAGLFFAFRPGATPEALVVSELLISALGALVSLPLALGVLPVGASARLQGSVPRRCS